jgi:hypothetical protein
VKLSLTARLLVQGVHCALLGRRSAQGGRRGQALAAMRLVQFLPMAVLLWATLPLAAQGSAYAPDPSVQGVQSPSAVQVSTDRLTYGPGDTVLVTVTNQGPATIMPHGGVICDSLWPIRLERSDSSGWEAVPVPQDPVCAAASVGLYAPGSSLSTTFTVGPECGTYRAVFAFDVPGSDFGSLAPAHSDPFYVHC